MEKEFLIDTNIIIYYLNGAIPEDHYEQVSEIFRTSFNLSTISKIEVLGWYRITDAHKLRIKRFLTNANVIYLNDEIEEKAIELKQTVKMDAPDAIIAATALVYQFTLVTRNEKDFKKVAGLTIYNPFEEG
jgi:predicted nucleic acid-binding protein